MLPVWSLMGNENWCMSGYHAVPVLADAIAKKVVTEKEAALQTMVETSNVDYYDHLDDYKELGYIPFEKSSPKISTIIPAAILTKRAVCIVLIVLSLSFAPKNLATRTLVPPPIPIRKPVKRVTSVVVDPTAPNDKEPAN